MGYALRLFENQRHYSQNRDEVHEKVDSLTMVTNDLVLDGESQYIQPNLSWSLIKWP